MDPSGLASARPTRSRAVPPRAGLHTDPRYGGGHDYGELHSHDHDDPRYAHGAEPVRGLAVRLPGCSVVGQCWPARRLASDASVLRDDARELAGPLSSIYIA